MTSPTSTRRAFAGRLAAILTLPAGAARAFALDAAALGLKPGSGEDQAATLVRLAERAAREGRVLALPPGRIVLNAALLPPNARLAGAPGTVLAAARPDAPILRLRGPAAALERIAFVGLPAAPKPEMALVACEGVTALDIRDCRFQAAPGGALRLRACGGRITGNAFEGVGDVALHALDSTGLDIAGNTIVRCGNNGIQVWRSQKGDDGARITGNRIADIRADAGGSGQNGNAVNVFRAGGCIVEGNVIRRVAYTAIRGNAANNLQVLGNNAADCGEVALYAEFGFDGAVIAGNVVERAAVGISVTNFDHGGRLAVVQGNLVRKLRRGRLPQGGEGGGVGIFVEAETAVTGNTVEEADESGLMLGWGEALKDVAATGNVVRGAGCGVAVSVAPGAGKALIAGNLIAGARNGAIVAREWTRTVPGDLARDGASRYPNLTVDGNRVA